jgi:FAD/FMN-containing dehydrogenase
VAGITIDLDRMNTVEISTDGNKARIGGGATTAKVYHDLDSHGLSFVGGRVGAVGVGGFTLGGGTSPFSNKYGLSFNNVFEYEVRP